VRQGLVVKDAARLTGGGNHFNAQIDRNDLEARFQSNTQSRTVALGDIEAARAYGVGAPFSDDRVEFYGQAPRRF